MSIFRNTFQTEISGSLAARQNAMVSRTPDVIQYLNSRNSFIRMTSSVNVGNDNGALAKNNVLLGGTLNPNGDLKSGVGNANEAYSTRTPGGTTNRLGLRPMAGITSMDIKSKSAYGSLREAVVNFQCWDIHQLEELELLYMRPGYTVLVEWGWLPHLNNSGKLVTTPPSFYDILNKGVTDRRVIFKQLYDKSTASGGNYDAMFGYIKNYQWSARPDGGYDCQTTIISTGEIIESLKVNYVLPDLTRLNTSVTNGDGFLNAEFTIQGTVPPNQLKEHYEKNILAGVWAETFKKLNGAQVYYSTTGTPLPTSVTLSPTSIFTDKFRNTAVPGLKSLNSNNPNSLSMGGDTQVYITLEAAFDVINKYVVPRDNAGNPLIELSTYTEEYTGTKEPLLCVAHPIEVSVDPTVCLIKSPLWYDKGGILYAVSGAAIVNPLQVKATAIQDAANRYIASKGNVAALQTNLSTGTSNTFKDAILAISNINEYQQINTLLGSTDIPFYLSNSIAKGGVLGLQESFYKDIINYLRSLTLTVKYTVSVGKLNPVTITIPAGTPPPPPSVVAISSVSNAITNLQNLKDLPKDFFFNADPNTELGYVGNIFVSVDFLYKQSLDPNLEASDNKEKNEINLYKYVKSIISAIQTSLGNVNSFEVHVDPIDNKARVIDVNFTGDKNQSNLFELQVHNLKSVVRNYSLQSQIFPEQSSIIAIGSQAKGGQLGIQNNTMIDFNRNITDRIIPEKDFGIPNNYDVNGGTTKIASNLGSIVFMFGSLTAPTPTPTPGSSTPAPASPGGSTDLNTLFTRCKSNLRDLIVYFQSITNSPGANRNIIPTKFSFEMDGIGGLVIGNLFTVNQDILPEGYKGTKGTGQKLAQTVTSIAHSLTNNNDWTTKIDALQISLNDKSNKATFSSLNNLNALIQQSFTNSLQSQNPSTSGTGSGLSPINFNQNNVPTNAQAIASFGQVSTAVPLGYRPLLDTIAYAEGLAGSGNYNGYDTLVTFKRIPVWSPTTTSGHPNQLIFVSSKVGNSTAAGRYQFLYKSWLGVNNNTNATFTPENQDKAATTALQGNGFTARDSTNAYTVAKQQIASNTIDVNKNPAFLKFLDKSYKIWASLPSSGGAAGYANQGGKYNPSSIYAVYIEAIKKY
jgi:muramidase (phage lysozyme)